MWVRKARRNFRGEVGLILALMWTSPMHTAALPTLKIARNLTAKVSLRQVSCCKATADLP